jgi:hypothetical protein
MMLIRLDSTKMDRRLGVMPKTAAAFLWRVIGILSIVLLAACCGPELDERVAIPGSRWIVSTQLWSCSAFDPGQIEIFAEDSESQKRVSLLVLDGAEDTHVEYLGANRIQISLPNLVAITSQQFSFGPYKIIYRYLPHDDPEERANYKKWIENPNDPAAKKWSDANIQRNMHPGVPRPNE